MIDMNTLVDVFNVACDIGMLIGAYYISKIKEYSDSFFNEKAKNLATKQDIGEITRKTEEVKTEFKELQDLFQADLKFKYDFMEKQYRELYADIYYLICQSEARRRVLNITDNNYIFEEVPFVEYSQTVGTINPKEWNQILTIIETHKVYASPRVLKLYALFKTINSQNLNAMEFSEKLKEVEVRVKKKLIETILKDFQELRIRLKLASGDPNEEVVLIKTGKFMEL